METKPSRASPLRTDAVLHTRHKHSVSLWGVLGPLNIANILQLECGRWIKCLEITTKRHCGDGKKTNMNKTIHFQVSSCFKKCDLLSYYTPWTDGGLWTDFWRLKVYMNRAITARERQRKSEWEAVRCMNDATWRSHCNKIHSDSLGSKTAGGELFFWCCVLKHCRYFISVLSQSLDINHQTCHLLFECLDYFGCVKV